MPATKNSHDTQKTHHEHLQPTGDLPGWIGTLVTAKPAKRGYKIRNGTLFLMKLSCVIAGFVWTAVSSNGSLLSSTPSLPLTFSLVSALSVVSFLVTKNFILHCTLQTALLTTLPILNVFISGSTSSSSLLVWSLSGPLLSSLFMPTASLFWLLFWGFSFNFHSQIHNIIITKQLPVIDINTVFNHLDTQTSNLFLFHCIMVIFVAFRIGQLTFRGNKPSHSKTMHHHGDHVDWYHVDGEHHHAITVNSPAEKIIDIMGRLKSTDCFGEHEQEIEYVINTVASGIDLYTPDIASLLEPSTQKHDHMTHAFLLHHQSSCTPDAYASPSQYTKQIPSKKVVMGAVLNLKTSSPLSTMLNVDKKINNALTNIDNWDFNIFELNEQTHGRPLYYMGQALFRRHNLIQKFQIDEKKLQNFLTCIEEGYHHDNPYHNHIHASDVAQGVHFFLTNGGLAKLVTDNDIFAAIVAALIHDFDHPGVNNNFEIMTSSERALLHNDLSVLENHHLASAFHILSHDSNNIFSSLSRETYKEIRSTIIDIVLATDFGKHLEVLGQFKSRRAAGELNNSKREDRVLSLKMAVKCADIGHTAKPLALHKQWTVRVTDEFFIQGDQEKSRGLPISPFMDREQSNIPKSQIGFIGFLVLPLYSAFVEEFTASKTCYQSLENNLLYWKQQLGEISPTASTPTNSNNDSSPSSSPSRQSLTSSKKG